MFVNLDYKANLKANEMIQGLSASGQRNALTFVCGWWVPEHSDTQEWAGAGLIEL